MLPSSNKSARLWNKVRLRRTFSSGTRLSRIAPSHVPLRVFEQVCVRAYLQGLELGYVLCYTTLACCIRHSQYLKWYCSPLLTYNNCLCFSIASTRHLLTTLDLIPSISTSMLIPSTCSLVGSAKYSAINFILTCGCCCMTVGSSSAFSRAPCRSLSAIFKPKMASLRLSSGLKASMAAKITL